MEKETKNKKTTSKKGATTKKKTTAKTTSNKANSGKKTMAEKKKVETAETKKTKPTVVKKNKLDCLKKYFKSDEQAIIVGGIILAVAILAYSIGFAVATKPIPTLSDGTEILAEIDGETITADDLYSQMKSRVGFGLFIEKIDNYIVNSKIEMDDDVLNYADNQMEQLKMQLEQQGEDFDTLITAWGFEDEDALYDYFTNERKRTILVNNYIRDNLTENEMKAYYENEIDGEMTVKHILIQPDYDTAETNEDFERADDEAMSKAEDLIERLNDGEDFDELAMEYSDDEGTADAGGLFGNFTKNQVVPEFWDASVALEDGEFSQNPVRSQYGYHIILRVEQSEKPDYEDVLDLIKDELLEEKRQTVENLEEKMMLEIRDEFNIVINDREIAREYEEYKRQIRQ